MDRPFTTLLVCHLHGLQRIAVEQLAARSGFDISRARCDDELAHGFGPVSNRYQSHPHSTNSFVLHVVGLISRLHYLFQCAARGVAHVVSFLLRWSTWA
jgi:hypothetical protein